MKAVICIALVCSQCVVAQHTTSKYLLDKDTKAPLRAATIHNANDYTITNDDGLFVFYSANDSITIKMLGYGTFCRRFLFALCSQAQW